MIGLIRMIHLSTVWFSIFSRLSFGILMVWRFIYQQCGSLTFQHCNLKLLWCEESEEGEAPARSWSEEEKPPISKGWFIYQQCDSLTFQHCNLELLWCEESEEDEAPARSWSEEKPPIKARSPVLGSHKSWRFGQNISKVIYSVAECSSKRPRFPLAWQSTLESICNAQSNEQNWKSNIWEDLGGVSQILTWMIWCFSNFSMIEFGIFDGAKNQRTKRRSANFNFWREFIEVITVEQKHSVSDYEINIYLSLQMPKGFSRRKPTELSVKWVYSVTSLHRIQTDSEALSNSGKGCRAFTTKFCPPAVQESHSSTSCLRPVGLCPLCQFIFIIQTAKSECSI